MSGETRITDGGLVLSSGTGPDGGAVIPASSLGLDEIVIEIELPSGHGERLTLANAAKLRDALTEALSAG